LAAVGPIPRTGKYRPAAGAMEQAEALGCCMPPFSENARAAVTGAERRALSWWRQLLSFRISGPRNRIVRCALAGVALPAVRHVPPAAWGAMPLKSSAYMPWPVAPAYKPVLLPTRIL